MKFDKNFDSIKIIKNLKDFKYDDNDNIFFIVKDNQFIFDGYKFPIKNLTLINWLSGYFDADGHISCYTTVKGYTQIRLNITTHRRNEELFKHLKYVLKNLSMSKKKELNHYYITKVSQNGIRINFNGLALQHYIIYALMLGLKTPHKIQACKECIAHLNNERYANLPKNLDANNRNIKRDTITRRIGLRHFDRSIESKKFLGENRDVNLLDDAWLSGFIDGDGSFSINNRYNYMTFSISQSEKGHELIKQIGKILKTRVYVNRKDNALYIQLSSRNKNDIESVKLLIEYLSNFPLQTYSSRNFNYFLKDFFFNLEISSTKEELKSLNWNRGKERLELELKLEKLIIHKSNNLKEFNEVKGKEYVWPFSCSRSKRYNAKDRIYWLRTFKQSDFLCGKQISKSWIKDNKS